MLKAVGVVEQHKPEKVIRLYTQNQHDFWIVRPGASSCFFPTRDLQSLTEISKYLIDCPLLIDSLGQHDG